MQIRGTDAKCRVTLGNPCSHAGVVSGDVRQRKHVAVKGNRLNRGDGMPFKAGRATS